MSSLTVVFDLDGTLVETAPDLCRTLNVVLEGKGLPPVSYSQSRALVGAGARVMIERGVAAAGQSLPTTEIDRMFADFIDYYAAHVADHSHPFPGLDIALDNLAARGCRFAVCTNKLEGLSRLLLEALGLTGRFQAICGQDTFGIAKPNPDVLRRTIAQSGGDLGRSIMVGDSATDIDTAKAAGVPVVAVDFGYTDIPVTQLGPDRVISHFRDLPEAVFALAADLN